MKTLLHTIPLLAWTLGGKSPFRFLLLLGLLWLFAFFQKILRTTLSIRFPFVYRGVAVPMYLYGITDIATLKEIYLNSEYDWELPFEITHIVDLGAHHGDTALYYHACHPKAEIIAVEPAPENFTRLQKNTAHIKQIVPVQAAVGGGDGTVELNLGESSLGYSITARKGTVSSVSVPQITLKTLFAEHGIQKASLIKFDIEGGEESLFVTDDPKEFADAYIGEVHEDLISIDFNEFASVFKDYSIEKIGLTNPHRFVMKAIRKTQ